MLFHTTFPVISVGLPSWSRSLNGLCFFWSLTTVGQWLGLLLLTDCWMSACQPGVPNENPLAFANIVLSSGPRKEASRQKRRHQGAGFSLYRSPGMLVALNYDDDGQTWGFGSQPVGIVIEWISYNWIMGPMGMEDRLWIAPSSGERWMVSNGRGIQWLSGFYGDVSSLSTLMKAPCLSKWWECTIVIDFGLFYINTGFAIRKFESFHFMKKQCIKAESFDSTVTNPTLNLEGHRIIPSAPKPQKID